MAGGVVTVATVWLAIVWPGPASAGGGRSAKAMSEVPARSTRRIETEPLAIAFFLKPIFKKE